MILHSEYKVIVIHRIYIVLKLLSLWTSNRPLHRFKHIHDYRVGQSVIFRTVGTYEILLMVT